MQHTETRLKPVKIGFLLLTNLQQPMPSTRIVVLNMLPFLRQANFEPHIVFENMQDTETPDVSGLASRLIAEGYHIVFFQKLHGASVAGLARQLSLAGIKTVYSVCDVVNTEMASVTDTTIVVTEYLKSLYPQELQKKIQIVHDGIEQPEFCKDNWGVTKDSSGRRLHAVLVTSSSLHCLPVLGTLPEWLEVSIVGRYQPARRMIQRLREDRWGMVNKCTLYDRMAYIRFMINRRIRRVAWDPVEVYEALLQADIGIIPIDTKPEHVPGQCPPPWKVKSENRLTMKMCVGLPVIATPIPAYEPVIEQGKNGFFAGSRIEWLKYLDELRDPLLRQEIGQRARESVLERYSMHEQARRLITIFTELA